MTDTTAPPPGRPAVTAEKPIRAPQSVSTTTRDLGKPSTAKHTLQASSERTTR